MVSEGNGLFFLFNKGLGGAGKEIGEEKNESGESLLFVTAKTPGSEVAMKWLVEKGADVNVKNEKDDKTPLHAAVESKHSGAVKVLLKSGADLTVKSKEGKTAVETNKELVEAVQKELKGDSQKNLSQEEEIALLKAKVAEQEKGIIGLEKEISGLRKEQEK